MKDRKPTCTFTRLAALCAFLLAIACSTPVATAGKPAATSDFVIEAKMKDGVWSDYGRFQASGAIHDSGRARLRFDGVLELYGNGGDMVIALWRDENGDRFFTIIEGTESHVGLVGITGTASGYFGVNRVYHTLMGSIAP
jgi:hypothetical protein